MVENFPLFPEAASTVAGKVDALYFFLVVVCGAMALLVAALIVYFAVKYRRRPGNEVPVEYEPFHFMESGVIFSMLAIFMVMFLWGAKVFFEVARVPDDALDVWVTGKQWMWKFQHIGGQSEINELHVPVGRPVRLIMISEDVIHDFFVPQFRVHTDVLPSRYTYQWFNATKAGTYNLFCSEYCGTDHSGMIGKVHVMDAAAYQMWLGGGAETTPAAEGKNLFERFACNSCHAAMTTARGPQLEGVFGTMVQLANGQSVKADENYLRESVLNPPAKVRTGMTSAARARVAARM